MSHAAEHGRTWTRDGFLISTDPSLVPIPALQQAFDSDEVYWARSIPEPAMRAMLDNSLVFGVYSPTPSPPPAADLDLDMDLHLETTSGGSSARAHTHASARTQARLYSHTHAPRPSTPPPPSLSSIMGPKRGDVLAAGDTLVRVDLQYAENRRRS